MTGSYRVKLWEADGSQRWWTIQFVKLSPTPARKTVYGRYDLDQQIIFINNRLRNVETIVNTIRHEVTHVALGVNATEFAVQSVEENFTRAVRAFKGVYQ